MRRGAQGVCSIDGLVLLPTPLCDCIIAQPSTRARRHRSLYEANDDDPIWRHGHTFASVGGPDKGKKPGLHARAWRSIAFYLCYLLIFDNAQPTLSLNRRFFKMIQSPQNAKHTPTLSNLGIPLAPPRRHKPLGGGPAPRHELTVG